jgi:hypothetical protein
MFGREISGHGATGGQLSVPVLGLTTDFGRRPLLAPIFQEIAGGVFPLLVTVEHLLQPD